MGQSCQKLKLKPAKLAAPFQPVKPDINHFTWGAAPFIAEDGRVCFYFTWLTGWADGNHTKPVPVSDTVSGECGRGTEFVARCTLRTPLQKLGSLGLACGTSVEGPFKVLENVAFPFRPGHYDASYIENAVLTYSPHDQGYLLAYTTSPPEVNRSTVNWEGNGELQYMGIAFTKDLMKGPWERLNRTILQPKQVSEPPLCLAPGFFSSPR
jgi:hypothetical protein